MHSASTRIIREHSYEDEIHTFTVTIQYRVKEENNLKYLN